jgi:4-hydroxybenzoate-CoA ligase
MTENQNAALWFVDRHVDEGRSAKIAFREADRLKRSLTYGALAVDTSVFAGALERHGVRRDERAAMIMLDQIEFPTVFWGALKAGVIPVPMNTLLSSTVYEAMLIDSRASILFVSDELWPVVEPAVVGNKFLRSIVVIGETKERTIDYLDFVNGAHAIDAVEADGDELAFWLYSSGSTGLPKGVKHIHSSLRATAENFGQAVLGIREDDVVYSVAKFFFAYGLGNAMSFPMSVGATTILLGGRATPAVVFSLFEHHRPTIFCGVPTLYAALIAAKDQMGGALRAPLRMCTSAGEALPRAVGEGWSEIWGVDIIDGVGSTEMLHIFLSNRPEDIVYGTSGIPVPGYEVRLVDENDEEVVDGAVGELLVRGPSSAEGYWNRRDKTQDTFQGHWTRSGDKYERNSDGRFVYCGRTDDMFKVSGIWVSPFEVEQALIEHPSVLEAAVVAWSDENGLEKPKAFVVLNEGVDASKVDELKGFVKDQIGMWKYPRWVEVMTDLPKTATGKIQRFKLRLGE